MSPNKRGRYTASQRRDSGAEDKPRSAWSVESSAVGGGWVPGMAHPCVGGCGVMVTTNKCSECAARAVGEWLRSTGNPNARYYQ